ncbi:unnamed protein product [Penicillium olsonii]|nr:unnamed protein product [Penicillium olsonii]CAG7931096.1 unnamed protein product [Penicillium olsonii]
MVEVIEIDPSKRDDLTPSEADMLHIMNEALTSEVDPVAAPVSLANSLRKYLSSQGSESLNIANTNLWYLWMILLEVVLNVPVDHPWHDILTATVVELRREGGTVAASNPKLKWEDLPFLRMYLFDKWAELDDYTPEDLEAWKQFNSFASRLLSPDFTPWLILPYWEIAAGLETVVEDAAVFECKIWAATEWLIRCGSIIFRDMSSKEELDSETSLSMKPGPLCADIPPLSVQRWDFWHSRLVELIENDTSNKAAAGGVPLPLSRLNQALAVMEKARLDVELEGQNLKDQDSSDSVDS